jgi:hypothetical protein
MWMVSVKMVVCTIDEWLSSDTWMWCPTHLWLVCQFLGAELWVNACSFSLNSCSSVIVYHCGIWCDGNWGQWSYKWDAYVYTVRVYTRMSYPPWECAMLLSPRNGMWLLKTRSMVEYGEGSSAMLVGETNVWSMLKCVVTGVQVLGELGGCMWLCASRNLRMVFLCEMRLAHGYACVDGPCPLMENCVEKC